MFDKTVKGDEKHIFIQHFCEFFGLDMESQSQCIKENYFLAKRTKEKSDTILFGDSLPRLCFDKIGFVRWIYSLSPMIFKPNSRDTLSIYTELIADYLIGTDKDNVMLVTLDKELNKLLIEYKLFMQRIKFLEREMLKATKHRYDYAREREHKRKFFVNLKDRYWFECDWRDKQN